MELFVISLSCLDTNLHNMTFNIKFKYFASRLRQTDLVTRMLRLFSCKTLHSIFPNTQTVQSLGLIWDSYFLHLSLPANLTSDKASLVITSRLRRYPNGRGHTSFTSYQVTFRALLQLTHSEETDREDNSEFRLYFA